MSDEIAASTWVEKPYSPSFTGETYLQIESFFKPSSQARLRKRIGEEGVETMVMATIKVRRKLGPLKPTSADWVIADTTVMPKAVAHPTDSQLLEQPCQHPVKLEDDNGIALRQNDNC